MLNLIRVKYLKNTKWKEVEFAFVSLMGQIFKIEIYPSNYKIYIMFIISFAILNKSIEWTYLKKSYINCTGWERTLDPPSTVSTTNISENMHI